jgi:hypothetical protein
LQNFALYFERVEDEKKDKADYCQEDLTCPPAPATYLPFGG